VEQQVVVEEPPIVVHQEPVVTQQQQPKTIELTDGWQQVFDENSQQYYYYNKNTQLSTWTRPLELDTPVVTTPVTPLIEQPTVVHTAYQSNGVLLNAHRAHSSSSPDLSQTSSPLLAVPTIQHLQISEQPHNKQVARRSTVLTTGSTARGVGSAARRRPTSTSSFTFSTIPEKCTGRHTLVTYGQSKFQQQRKGIFRSVVPTNKLLLFTNSKLSQPLHEIPRENHILDCITFFDLVQLYMLDRKFKDLQPATKDLLNSVRLSESEAESLSKNVDVDIKLAKALMNICLKEVVIRNECIILTCKQCNGNPTPSHTVRGLQLLGLLLTAFPPTNPNLQEAVIHFLQVLQLDPRATEEMKVYCQVGEKRLRRSILTGPRKSLPSDAEFKNMTQRAGVENHVFGVTIEEYMNWQNETILDQANEHNNDPVVLVVLAEILERLNGFETEGIFRLPGHTAQVEKLRDDLSTAHEHHGRKQLAVGAWVRDPHICASVFKLWLRELADPIIPDDIYEKCVSLCADPEQCVQLAKSLPDDNRIILNFVIHFLSRLCEEEVTKKTKMNIENLAVVFAPNILRNRSTDPMAIMRNSNSEKQFVKTLVQANLEAAKRGELNHY
jgi:hypothetical protein